MASRKHRDRQSQHCGRTAQRRLRGRLRQLGMAPAVAQLRGARARWQLVRTRSEGMTAASTAAATSVIPRAMPALSSIAAAEGDQQKGRRGQRRRERREAARIGEKRDERRDASRPELPPPPVEQRRRGRRHRDQRRCLPEHGREPCLGHELESDRQQLHDGHGNCGQNTVARAAHDHPVEKQERDGLGHCRHDPEQAHAIGGELRERQCRHIEGVRIAESRLTVKSESRAAWDVASASNLSG